MLYFADGGVFAVGASPLSYRPASDIDKLDRLFVRIEVEGQRGEAIIDTGGAYLIPDPFIASALGLQPEFGLGVERLRIRGVLFEGTLHKVFLTFLAEQGHSLQIEAPAFVVPEWPLPSYLGMRACLELVRFGIDLSTSTFYFGAAPQ